MATSEQTQQADVSRTLEQLSERPPRQQSGLQRLLSVRETAITVVAVIIFIFFSFAAPCFFSKSNLFDMAREMAFTSIVATGMTFVFIAGELDLSVGSLYGLATMALAYFIATYGWDPWLAAAAMLVLCLFVGTINAVVTTVIGVPSFIVTLGMLSLLAGITLVVSGAFPINYPHGLHSAFLDITGSYIYGLPVSVLWMVVFVGAGILILKFTPFGYHVYATGGNVKAAFEAGINTRRTKAACFLITSSLVGVIACLQGGWLLSADPTNGTHFELDVIGATIIGGVGLTGGAGNVYGSAVGAAILAMLTNGIVLMGVNGNYNQIFIGLIIVGVGSLDRGLRGAGGRGGLGGLVTLLRGGRK